MWLGEGRMSTECVFGEGRVSTECGLGKGGGLQNVVVVGLEGAEVGNRAFLNLCSSIDLCSCVPVKRHLVLPKYCPNTQVRILPRTVKIPGCILDTPIYRGYIGW